MELSTKVSDVVLTKVCEIKPDSDSNLSKQVTLRVRFDGVTLGDVFAKAMSQTVIQWQAKARKTFASWTDRGVVDVDFKAPARTVTDPEQEMIAKLATMTPEKQVVYLQDLAKKAQNQQ